MTGKLSENFDVKQYMRSNALLLGAMLSLITGCGESGPTLTEVQGTVLLDGKPLPNASLEFSPEKKGSPSYGTTDESGRYKLRFDRDRDGAEPGPHKVRISMEGDSKIKLPSRYNEQTELREVVSPGGSTIDFDLKTK